MDSSSQVEELKRLLQEEKQRTAEEKQRADKEKQRADEEKQRADEANEQIQNTTLLDYLEGCHGVYSHLTIQARKALTTKGTITKPRDKLCPDRLEAWPDFFDVQKTTLGALFSNFPADKRAFQSKHFLQTLGLQVSRMWVGSEKALETFLHFVVEAPVANIVDAISHMGAEVGFDVGKGIVFENHVHAISELSEEVVDRLSNPSPPQTPGQHTNNSLIRPDQICVYRSEADERVMVYVCEYKAPHKLTTPHLRAGLRPMDIHREVVNRPTIPTEDAAKFVYHAERLTAAAVTQTYHYMIEGGLQYGLLTTGEAIVFLKVDWDEPGTLYYHLAEPGPEANAHPVNIPSCSAVGQCLAFSLLALENTRAITQGERLLAASRLNRWAEDFESALRAIPSEERPGTGSSFAPEATSYANVDRSPYMLRKRRRRHTNDDHPRETSRTEDPTSSSDEGPQHNVPGTPTPAPRQLPSKDESSSSQQSGNTRKRKMPGKNNAQYCTQKCLVGLVRGSELDLECPNVSLHRSTDTDQDHPVNHKEWLQLLYQQLERTLDDGIMPLKKGGARAVLFKVTLLQYGYTFVGKGTVKAFIPDLKHEAAVYERLRQHQGTAIPVYLGSIDLRDMKKVYYYDFRVYIVHLTFLSWGGDSLSDDAVVPKKKIQGLLRLLHNAGVAHRDVRKENVLFNPDTNDFMIIDFERSLLLDQPVPAKLIPAKRGRVESKSSRHAQDGRRVKYFKEDMSMWQWDF